MILKFEAWFSALAYPKVNLKFENDIKAPFGLSLF